MWRVDIALRALTAVGRRLSLSEARILRRTIACFPAFILHPSSFPCPAASAPFDPESATESSASAPFPSLLSIASSPPCSRTIRRDDEKSEAGPAALGCEVGLEDAAQVFGEMPPPVSVKLIFTCVSSRSVRMRRMPRRFIASKLFLIDVVKEPASSGRDRASSSGRSERSSVSTTMSRSLISGAEETDRFLHDRVDILGMQLRLRRSNGAEELGHDRIEPVDLGARDVDRFLQLALVFRRPSFFTLRSINWRWMWRELSGLPISCATPAASKVSAERRSDSMVCWVERRFSVMSRRIMA